VLARPDLATASRSIASIRAALDMAGLGMAEIDHLDLYSCFAIAVFNVTDAFALSPDDPRGLTLTGGLPFFGGAGNNYSTHAIAEAVHAARARPGSTALVGANGGILSKYATGLYSTRPADWRGEGRYRSLADPADIVPVLDRHTGPARVESYTIIPRPDRTLGAVAARTPDGARLIAITADDTTLATLAETDPFARAIAVTTGADGRNEFRFA